MQEKIINNKSFKEKNLNYIYKKEGKMGKKLSKKEKWNRMIYGLIMLIPSVGLFLSGYNSNSTILIILSILFFAFSLTWIIQSITK